MKGTEKIIAHIQADAKSQADAILAQAQQQCAVIDDKYKKKSEEAYGEKIRVGVKACEDAAEGKERIANMESKKDILALKQEMVAAAFDKAKEMILGLPEEKYLAFLEKLVVRSVSTGDEQIILNQTDKAKYGSALIKAVNEAIPGSKLTLSEETGDFEGGLIMRRGSVEVNNTLSLLIDLCRGEMSSQVARVLFE